MFEILRNDLLRHGIRQAGLLKILYCLIFSSTPGVRFVVNFRILQYLLRKYRVFAIPFYFNHRRLKIKYGFDISYRTKIGRGLYLGHFGGVVIHGDTIIGDNCNISQGVTIGVSNHNRIGSPMIGNNVFLGPGATVIGQIEIGHNVTIGTNSIVNFHVPDCTTVVASRSHIIEKDLSPYYIQNKT